MAAFMDRLADQVRAKRSPLMVGLDPRRASLPKPLRPSEDADPQLIAEAYYEFCYGIIDTVKDLTPVVKPQVAFFEQLGPAGMIALGKVIERARESELLVVVDGKRNDIGSTAEAYADGWLGDKSCWRGDALTVSPYLGDDSLEPFTKLAADRDAGVFILVKTSNPGGALWQDKELVDKPLYLKVGEHVEGLSEATAGESGYGVAGAVVGATYPDQLTELRKAMPHSWFLVPGFGSQGGTAADVAGGFDERGLGAVINSSRGIIFAYNKAETSGCYAPDQWKQAVRTAAEDAVSQLRASTPAGKL